jgi:hypothetical protein
MRVVDDALAGVGCGTGAVEEAVRALIAGNDIEDGSYAASLAQLAVAQARMADAGNSHASVACRGTLERLDDVLGLCVPMDGEWFSILDVRFGITREGINPKLAIGKALLKRGYTELITHFPPPEYPPGWRGTAVDGDPLEYAEKCALDYRDRRPPVLGYWPELPCENCGHVRQPHDHHD